MSSKKKMIYIYTQQNAWKLHVNKYAYLHMYTGIPSQN